MAIRRSLPPSTHPFGSILATWRSRRSITQTKLARRIGRNQSAVSHAEVEGTPSLEVLGAIVRELDPPAEEVKAAILRLAPAVAPDSANDPDS